MPNQVHCGVGKDSNLWWRTILELWRAIDCLATCISFVMSCIVTDCPAMEFAACVQRGFVLALFGKYAAGLPISHSAFKTVGALHDCRRRVSHATFKHSNGFVAWLSVSWCRSLSAMVGANGPPVNCTQSSYSARDAASFQCENAEVEVSRTWGAMWLLWCSKHLMASRVHALQILSDVAESRRNRKHFYSNNDSHNYSASNTAGGSDLWWRSPLGATVTSKGHGGTLQHARFRKDSPSENTATGNSCATATYRKDDVVSFTL
jgi:hypothetical protein